MAVYKSISEIVGATPLAELRRYGRINGLNARILAKLEYLNPAGSVKDRTAMNMIDAAERSGKISPGDVIIEPTSGNTGIGLAAIGAARGYRVILTMPETMSPERRGLLKTYGGEIVLTDGAKGMSGAVAKAESLAKELGGVVLGQFSNPANAGIHALTTGPEIWKDIDGEVDIFVACVGTGGTLTGAGGYLKSKKPSLKIIAVEPSASPVLSKGLAGEHRIQGIGAGFVPDILDVNLYDEVITVSDEEAFSSCREIIKTEGYFVGLSSGAALYAAKLLAERKENYNKTIVAVFPDSGDRYLSVLLSET